ncbi:MAG: hypothetical protein RMJ17_01385 [Candidatus Aenigmarchaeota archaeon]|nr:hypothetical protein [Candidatus Aenigmarchaeota archaeon]MDW8149233.1 hypothetical protein [Candidatus Aenigmarchaeota archaeon]
MAERKPIDEFVFILMAGLVLISIIIVYQYSQNQTTNNVTNLTIARNIKIFNFGDFEISYQIGTENIIKKENIRIEKSIFSENFVGYSFEISSDKLKILQASNLEVSVHSTSKNGKIIIKINGNEAVNEVLDSGTYLFEVSKSFLQEKNKIEILVEKLPTWKFWQPAFYEISFKFYINYAGQSFKDFSFTLEEDDLKKFENAFISFKTSEESVKNGKVTIRLNGGKIYSDIPPLLTNITIDFVGKFNKGKNKLEFSTEPGSVYKIENLIIVISKRR